ncbi:MAG: Hsp70 family protein [Planctomycetaceae bacterium]
MFARDHGRTLPGRMIESAKSWLCHNGVDRRAALLPWHGAEDVERVSPVEATSRYIRHIKNAWDASHIAHPLAEQDVVVTIPASFDEVARELTVAAARTAGLPRIVLLEEPQAAFYSWVDAHRDKWEQIVSPGQSILVCDIGGGTSDFSLIHVRSGAEGHLQFHRVAVGDHLLLGGDNLDLALAHLVESKLTNGGQLDPRQWSTLIPACRHAKEILLGVTAPETYTVVLSGSGSRLVGGALQAVISRNEVHQLFVEGFLPACALDERPQKRQSGFQEFGLPYAADPAITRYLATFLRTHATLSDQGSRPDIVLFNGGFFASPVLRARLIEMLERWYRPKDAEWSPVELRNDRLDLAVARGAAYFGMVRRGVGMRIVAGLSRTYYVGIEQADGTRAALCLIAAGTESTSPPTVIDQVFKVRTAEPVEFPILVSGTRLTDQPGQIIPYDPEQLTALPPIRTVLTTRRRGNAAVVDARLSASLTEIGTLDLWCEQIDASRRWQLQFDVRSATETDRDAHTGIAEQAGIMDQELVTSAIAVLQNVFAPQGTTRADDTMKQLAEAIGQPRTEWPSSLLRAMWSELIDLSDGRGRSAQHESRWLNLTGFCLRPGFGMAADDWRVEETWRAINGRLLHSTPACLAELRTLCRRISGGLNSGRQTQIASAIMPAIRQRCRQVQSGRGKSAAYASGNHEAAEIWRMLGSLELLTPSLKIELGDIIIEFLNRPAFESIRNALVWSLGRIGGRVPVYGPLNLVVPTRNATEWIEVLLRTGDITDATTQLTLMQLTRRTDDRFRDVDASVRQRVLEGLTSADARNHLISLIDVGGSLESDEASQILGESLPVGLRLG